LQGAMPPLREAGLRRRAGATATKSAFAVETDDNGEPIHVTNEGDFSTLGEILRLLFGVTVLVTFGPFIACQIACCTLWEWVDKRTINLIGFSTRLAEAVSPVTNHFVKSEKDGFMVLMLVLQGVLLPAWFFYELHLATIHGVQWHRIFLYNLGRIGPMYMNFMYCYTLCHKEAHNFGNLFKQPYNRVFKFVFNRWVGVFHGVLPGVFTISHVFNHHKYDNGDKDVICTILRPRDRFSSLVKFLPGFFAYASNVSTVQSLIAEGKTAYALQASLGTLYYLAIVSACAYVQPLFTLCTLVYAFVEGNVLLSVVQIGWHAFVDEDDPTNDYINSTTIVDGVNFTLNEEYHVVHHQYAGAHWGKYVPLYEKHAEGYQACVPTIFQGLNLFELYGMVVANAWDELADKFYHPLNPGLSKEELILVLKKRVRSSGKKLAATVGRTQRAKGDDVQYQ